MLSLAQKGGHLPPRRSAPIVDFLTWRSKCKVPVHIIAMPSRWSYAKELEQRLARHFRDVMVKEAIDTRGLSDSDLEELFEQGAVSKTFAQTVAMPEHGRGAIGCAYSHLSAWHSLLHNHSDWMVVLEDDVEVDHVSLVAEIESVLKEGNQNEKDFVILGCNGYYAANGSLLPDPPFAGVAPDWEHLVEMNGTQGYLISRSGASSLIKSVLKTKGAWQASDDRRVERGLRGHIDHMISEAGISGVLTMACPMTPSVFNNPQVAYSSTRTAQSIGRQTTASDLLALRREILETGWKNAAPIRYREVDLPWLQLFVDLMLQGGEELSNEEAAEEQYKWATAFMAVAEAHCGHGEAEPELLKVGTALSNMLIDLRAFDIPSFVKRTR